MKITLMISENKVSKCTYIYEVTRLMNLCTQTTSKSRASTLGTTIDTDGKDAMFRFKPLFVDVSGKIIF